MRFRRLPWDESRVLVTSLSGDWLLMPSADFARVVDKELRSDEPLFADLQARHLIMADAATSTLAPLLSQYRTRKACIEHGPKLH
ncbi:MAG: His-Xaa-Ser system radical SAM maturase HxsB, partial [Lysobacterales bacterium 13-68-4]